MIRYTIRRLLWLIPVLLGVIIIVFTLSNLMPGDPVINKLGTTNYTQEQYDAVAEELGLDKPFLQRLVNYIVDLVTKGELGTSYQTNQDVSKSIGNRLWVTVRLGVISVLVSVVVSIPLGVWAAMKQKKLPDYIITFAAVILSAVPSFWLALQMILLFSLRLGWLPTTGLSTWKHYIMPVICNAVATIAVTVRMTRSSMLETVRQDYIRTARAKGLPERTVITKHALRNALIPVITVIGAQVGSIVGGSVIIESIFSIPGIGTLLVTGINNRDYPMIMGVTLLISIFTCIMNLVVDLCYAAVDPRIRAQFSGGKKKKKKEPEKQKAGVQK